MLSWIMQQPMVIIAIGLVVVAFLLYAWMQTSRRWLIYAAAGTALGVTGVVLAEQAIETDDEAIRRRVRQIAAAVEENDHTAVLGFIARDAEDCRKAAQFELPTYVFQDCTVASMKEITVDQDRTPKIAKAVILVWVYTTAPNFGFFEPIRGDRIIELKLREEGPKNWLITDYDHWDPRQHRFRRSSDPSE